MENEGKKNISLLEYAWNVTPVNQLKCDPCVGNPPAEQDLVQSGVWWLYGKDWNDYSDIDNDEPDNGDRSVYFTRLHVRYNRKSFPQDLMFQVTPIQKISRPATLSHIPIRRFQLRSWKKYLQDLKRTQKKKSYRN